MIPLCIDTLPGKVRRYIKAFSLVYRIPNLVFYQQINIYVIVRFYLLSLLHKTRNHLYIFVCMGTLSTIIHAML